MVGSLVAVVVILTLPKLVIVPEPVTAPVRVITGSAVLVVASDTLPLPSILALPVTAPVRLSVRAVCHALAVVAFPLRAPSNVFATRVPAVIVKSPVLAPVAVVVPTINLSALSSQPINALSPVLPLSITIPLSLAFEPAPLLSSIKLSLITVFVVASVVVVPFTVRSPLSVKFTPVAVPVKAGAARRARSALSLSCVLAIVMLAVPSKLLPAIVLAVASAVAVSALPVTSPVTLPVNAPAKADAVILPVLGL